MTQEWHDVLFLHWPVPYGDLREHIPSELELDLFNETAWIGIVFFRVKENRLRFVPPIPGLDYYLELNVRTYVTYNGMAGTYFFSLDADHPIIAKLPTIGDFLPYRKAKISYTRMHNKRTIRSNYKHSTGVKEIIHTSFEPIPGVINRNPLEKWLTERYRLWTKTNGYLFRVDIRHHPWELQYVTGTIFENTMAPYVHYPFHGKRPVAHYSKLKKTRFFPPVLEK